MRLQRVRSHPLVWTVGTHGLSILLRLLNNVILALLLGPEQLGIITIMFTVRLGIELLSDIGIEQNIVKYSGTNLPRFLDVAWTLQVIRGVILSIVLVALTPTLANLFAAPAYVFYFISVGPLLNSLHSTSIFVLTRNVDTKRRNLFEIRSEITAFVLTVAAALITPTVGAVIFGFLGGIVIRTALSFRLPHGRRTLAFDRKMSAEVFGFGKWLAVASLLTYACGNMDRLFVAAFEPLSVVGLYGMARVLADMPQALSNKITYQVVFPQTVQNQVTARSTNTNLIKYLAVGLSCLVGVILITSDAVVALLYDSRYVDVGWMLFLLAFGSWFSMMSALGEANLLARGAGRGLAAGNVLRFAVLALMFPLGYQLGGLPVATLSLGLAEACRFGLVVFLQRTNRKNFLMTAATGVACLILVVAIGLLVRQVLDLGFPWDGIRSEI